MLDSVNKKNIDYLLFLSILLTTFMPTIYKTVRIHFIGEFSSIDAVNVVAQSNWVQAVYEVLQEGLLLPLYYLLSKPDDNHSQFSTKITQAFVIFIIAYFLVSVVMIYSLDALIIIMRQKKELYALTKQYTQLESISMGLFSIYIFIQLIFYIRHKTKYVYYLLIAQVAFSILFDILLVSDFSISFQFGVIGIAYTDITVNVILIFISILLLAKLHIKFSFKNWKNQSLWLKEWARLFFISGSESGIRNLAFIWMILQMVNSTGQSGTYWLANNFIWGWLLIPIISLSTLIKIDVAQHQGQIGTRFIGYFVMSAFFIFVWFIFKPFWSIFLQNVMNISNYQQVLSIIDILVWFYIFFAYKSILDSYFYGMRRFGLLWWQNLIVNVVYYGVAYGLYSYGYLSMTLVNIAYLFGWGLVFSACIATLFWYKSGYHQQFTNEKITLQLSN